MNIFDSSGQFCPRWNNNLACMPVDLWRDMLSGDILAGVLLLLVTALVAVIVGFTCYMIYYFVDTATGEHQEGVARVIEKFYNEPSTTMVLVGTVPVTTTSSESWSVCLEVGCGQGTMSVDEATCATLRKGQTVHAKYIIGGLSGKPHFESFTY